MALRGFDDFLKLRFGHYSNLRTTWISFSFLTLPWKINLYKQRESFIFSKKTRFLFKDLNKLKLLYQSVMRRTVASLFKSGVPIGRWNCCTNEAKNKLFSDGVSKVDIGRATALLMPFSQLQSNPKPFKSNRENLKKQLKPSIEVNRMVLAPLARFLRP